MNWEDLHHFRTLAQQGSFSAAARALGVDHTTVARRVSALEAALGLRLVDRLPRSVVLTEAGAEIAELAKGAEDAAFAVLRAAQGARSGPAAPVRVSAPPALAACVIAPRLRLLRARQPEIVVTLCGQIGAADLDRREADVALRLSRPRQAGLIARKLGDLAFGFYGAPGTPPDETGWTLIAGDSAQASLPQFRWLEARLAGRPVAFRSDDSLIQAGAARAGLGVALLPDVIAATDPGLVRLQSREMPPLREIWMLVHDDLRRAPAVRLVMDFLAEQVQTALELQTPEAAGINPATTAVPEQERR